MDFYDPNVDFNLEDETMNKPTLNDFKIIMDHYYYNNLDHYDYIASSKALRKVSKYYNSPPKSGYITMSVGQFQDKFKEEYPEEYLLWKMKR